MSAGGQSYSLLSRLSTDSAQTVGSL